jgi:hypothetical protein
MTSGDFTPSDRGLSTMVPPIQPRTAFGRSGRMMIIGAVIASACAVVLRDEPGGAGVGVATALMTGSLGVMFVGAPFARRGEPALLRVAVLVFCAMVGLALQALTSPVVALGVLTASYALMVLSGIRWPPPTAPAGADDEKPRLHAGPIMGACAILFAVLSAWLVVAAMTDEWAIEVSVAVLGLALMLWVGSRLFTTYRVGVAADRIA